MHSELIEKIIEFNPHYKDKLDIDKDITFGIEIECEDIYMYKIKDALKTLELGWKNCYDYSLQDIGAEIISPILRNKELTYLEIKQICNMLKELKANPSKNASFQIHYGIDIFKDDYNNILNFYKLWSIYENVIYRYSYGNRNTPRVSIYKYAEMCGKFLNELLNRKGYISFAEYDNNEFIENVNNYSVLLGNNRVYGLSFRYDDYKNLKDVKTIEIRPMNGTIDEIMIQNYIKFFYELLNYPSRNDFDQEYIDYRYDNIKFSNMSIKKSTKINIEDAFELAYLVLNDEYDRLCFLKQYIKDDILVRKL